MVDIEAASNLTTSWCRGRRTLLGPVSFDLRQLRYFVTVAQEGSLTRAAAKIPVAQQSLSEQIRALERQVGARLFVRGPRGVQLTDVGAALLSEAKPLLTRADRSFDRVRRLAIGERQTLHVGFLPSVGNYIIPPVVRAFTEAHPETALTTEDLSDRATRRRTP